MEEELYRWLDDDSGQMICKLAHESDEDSKDVKAGTMIKDKYRKLVTDRIEVLQVWEKTFKTLLNKREERKGR